MRNRFVNLCHNPRFSLWPWGTSGFTGVASPTNYGKTAARWFLQTTAAGGDTVTVSRGVNPASSGVTRANTLQAATSTTATLDAGASATNGAYVGMELQITSGLANGFTTTVTAYNGSTKVATVSPAFPTTPSAGDAYSVGAAYSTKYDKWLQGQPNMTITVTARAANTTMRVRQFIEGGAAFGQNIIAMTVIASGPNGATFSYGAGDNYSTLTTLGDDADGNPVLVTATEFFPFDDPQYEYLRLTPFESPSATGTYRLHYVQAEVLMDPTRISDLEIRPDWFEWDIIARYVTPIRQGMLATGNSATTIRLPVVAPPGGWRTTPVVATEGQKSSFNITLNSTGTVINNAAPVYGLAGAPAANALGCVLTLAGFTTTASASQYVIGPETDPICYLNADYF